jgi:hypothetical protein
VLTLERGRRRGVGNADARPAMGRMAPDQATLGPGRRRLGQAGDGEDSDGTGGGVGSRGGGDGGSKNGFKVKALCGAWGERI